MNGRAGAESKGWGS